MGRARKKGKTSWYKDRTSKKGGVTLTHQGGTKYRILKSKEGASDKKLKTRAVIFVEKTPRVELARLVREQINGMGATLGFKLKVLERTGRKLYNRERSVLSVVQRLQTKGSYLYQRREHQVSMWGKVQGASRSAHKNIGEQPIRWTRRVTW